MSGITRLLSVFEGFVFCVTTALEGTRIRTLLGSRKRLHGNHTAIVRGKDQRHRRLFEAYSVRSGHVVPHTPGDLIAFALPWCARGMLSCGLRYSTTMGQFRSRKRLVRLTKPSSVAF